GARLPGRPLRAVRLHPRPLRRFPQLRNGRPFAGRRQECEQWPVLSQNVVYADTAGDIAWQLVGDTPRRKGHFGTLPAHAADQGMGWEPDPVPFSELPFVHNPPQGFVATANNKPAPDGTGPYLGSDWLDGYRANRIAEVLAGREDWDVPGFQRLQLDEE